MTTVEEILDGRDITTIDEEDITYLIAEHAGDLDHDEFGKALDMLATPPQQLIIVKKRCKEKGTGSAACDAYHSKIDKLHREAYKGDNKAEETLRRIGELDGGGEDGDGGSVDVDVGADGDRNRDNGGDGKDIDIEPKKPWET